MSSSSSDGDHNENVPTAYGSKKRRVQRACDICRRKKGMSVCYDILPMTEFIHVVKLVRCEFILDQHKLKKSTHREQPTKVMVGRCLVTNVPAV